MTGRDHRKSGRGATGNALSGRFNLPERHDESDWIDARDLIDGEAAAPRTEVTVEHPRTIITRNQSPDIPFDRSINPYRGCEHGCVYCYARPSHAYLDLSPGLDFETRLFAKPEAAILLRKELAKPGYQVRPIAFGTNTDPYQPVERDWRITRDCLEVLAACRHPVTITTKSDRILRDLDLLADMASANLAAVAISVTTLDPKIAHTLEPRAPRPDKRLAAIRALSDAGVPVFASISPIIPGITDHEIEAILAAVAKAGAKGSFYIPIRLPLEVSGIFQDWLDMHFPDRASKVMAIIRSLRDGQDNDSRFFGRMQGSGVWADLIRTRFRIASRQHGLDRHDIKLDCSQFAAPRPDSPQLSLF